MTHRLPARTVSLALAFATSFGALALTAHGQAGPAVTTGIPPIDPQKVQDQDNMTWADYKPIPNVNWQDPTKKASVRSLRVALIAIDFPDYPFVITRPKKSDPFGNPQIDPVKREDVAKFYADFWHKPSEINHGQTINGYWMEQSRGKYGIAALDAFGPYKMPRPLWSYGLAEHGQQNSTPDGSTARQGMEGDCDALWRAEPGISDAERTRRNTTQRGGEYDQILRIYSGYDETGTWQEFGEMKFETREDITPEWGNPNPEMPRWIPTRYVPWTSWLAGMQQWGVSSIRQGENSGTIMHELGHSFFSTGDNNNNPYAEPYRRVGSGPWDMMDRGSFNGPGGPHTRWVVPVQAGGSMPAGLMLRQKINFGFLDGQQRGGRRGGGAAAGNIASVLYLSREGLAKSGVAVAKVVARAVEPGQDQLAGIVVQFDGTPVPLVGGGGGRGGGRGGRGGRGGAATEPATASAPAIAPATPAAGGPTTQDRTPWVDPVTDPLSPGTPNFSNYTIEVVQRIGYDSYCPDSGVLLAKNKDQESGNGGPNGYTCFNWVIDAHPENINVIDYKKPKSGTPVMRTVADFRQLNDALFHAGLKSGSQYEYEDKANRLHFYIIDPHTDANGILSYTVAVKSLDGGGPQARDVKLEATGNKILTGELTQCEVTLTNTGKAASVDASTHPQDTTKYLDSDVYRLSVSVTGGGSGTPMVAELQNALAAVKFGQSVKIPVFVTRPAGTRGTADVVVTATSESDPTKTTKVSFTVTAN